MQPQPDGSPTAASRLFLAKNGNVGIHQDQPRFTLDVGGTVATRERLGTFRLGRVPADKDWHTIADGLQGMHALEVVAIAKGPAGRGRYAITQAVALGMPGPNRRRIRQNRSYLGFFWNRIELRWHYTYHEDAREGQAKYTYALQARTRTNYGVHDNGETCSIDYHITSLWHEQQWQNALGAITINAEDPSTNPPDAA
jgi:hypothetical protein